MALYEIINMSDAYTIECPSLDIAFTVCILLGEGQYGMQSLEDESLKVPIFLFGGVEEWCSEKFGSAANAVLRSTLDDKAAEVATSLESCVIGDRSDREMFTNTLALIDDPEKREQFKAQWHDKNRSSMNDIGKRAKIHAARLRTKIAKNGFCLVVVTMTTTEFYDLR